MPILYSADDFRRERIPSKRTFKKALGFIRDNLKELPGISYASLYGSAAYGKDVSYASDIDLFVVYDSRTEEIMQLLRGMREHLDVPIEIHAVPVHFLKEGVWASGGSFGHAIQTASASPELVIVENEDFDKKLLFQKELHPVSGFFGSKHTKMIKLYTQKDSLSDHPGKFMPCHYKSFLQKLIQIPHHTIRNVLYYHNPYFQIPYTKQKLYLRWREVFGSETLERYEGLFEVERDYVAMVETFTKTKHFDRELYTQVIQSIENKTFEYIYFVEDAVMMLFHSKNP
jgi:predicted nucleotidyltransferase